MARGFGSTYGSGTTDAIDTNLSTWDSTGKFSLSSWQYRNGNGGSNQGRVFDNVSGPFIYYVNGGTDYIFRLPYTTTNGDWRFPIIATGSWVHVAVTFDGSGGPATPVVYYDGVSQSVTEVAAAEGSYSSTGTDLIIGNNASSGGTRVFDGMFAEVAVWGDRVLTAAEAVSLANGVQPPDLGGGIPPTWYRSLLSAVNGQRPMGVAPSVTGTAEQDHPDGIYWPAGPILVPAAAAAGNARPLVNGGLVNAHPVGRLVA